MQGERFASLPTSSATAKTSYVIDTFVAREVAEKWVDRDGNVILSREGHLAILRSIAEEMWRGGAFVLDSQEIRISAELALAELALPAGVVRDILDRMPTHGVLIPKGRGLAFIHDRFLQYFVGTRIGELCLRGEGDALRALLEASSMGPDISEWAVWQSSSNSAKAIDYLCSGVSLPWDTVGRLNCGSLLAGLIRTNGTSPLLEQQLFSEQDFYGAAVTSVTFEKSSFWQVDFRGAAFTNCTFSRCEFGEVLLDLTTSFKGSVFSDCTFTGAETGDGHAFGKDLVDLFERIGGKVILPSDTPAQPTRTIRPELLETVERAVRSSEKTCDVAIEDLEEDFGADAKVFHKLALEHQVVRFAKKDASGKPKTFFRFKVDRSQFLAGQAGPVGNEAIDGFWAAAEKRSR
jgi:hypothetical protein